MLFSRKISISLLVLCISITGLASHSSNAAPLSDEGHPRLFFTAADIPDLRAKAASTHQEIWQPILAFADAKIGYEPPVSAPADGDQDTYRVFGNQLISFAFACVLTGDPDHCELATNTLRTYARWTQWGENNLRSLGLAHMLLGNALAYDWLYDTLTPDDQQLVRRSLARWTQAMYEASAAADYRDEWDNWWRKSYMQNHFIIANSAMGLAALALKGEYIALDCSIQAFSNVNMRSGPGTEYDIEETLIPNRSTPVISQTNGSDGYIWWQLDNGLWVRSDVVQATSECDNFAQGVDPQVWIDQAVQQLTITRDIFEGIGDGTWHESVKYQQYALSIALPFWYTLRANEGIDLIPHTYLRNYTDWRLYNHIPNSAQFIMAYGNFEWSWGSANTPSLLRFIAAETGDPHAEWLAREIAATDQRDPTEWETPWYSLEFLYYDAAIEPQAPDDLPGARVFPDLEGVIWRTGWGEDDLIFGLKTGPYGGRFAFDTYTQKIYPWDPACTSNICQLNMGHDHDDTNTFYLYQAGAWMLPETVGVGNMATDLHNSLLIDGQGQFRPKSNTVDQRPENFVGTDGFLAATANTPNFNYVASDATRRYKNIDGIRDVTRYVVFVRPDYLVMVDSIAADTPHTYEWVTHFGENGWREDEWIHGVADNGQALGIGMVAPAEFDVTDGNDGNALIHIRTQSPVDNTRFINILYPTTEDQWQSKPTFSLLEDNGSAAAVRITFDDGRTDDIIVTYGDFMSGVGPYAFDGQVAVLSYDPNGSLTHLFVTGGTELTPYITGEPLASNLDPAEPFEVIYSGQKATVSGTLTSRVTLYAPGINTLTVNDQLTPFDSAGDYLTFGE